MCGRFVATTTPSALGSYFQALLGSADEVLVPSFNVAPTDAVPAIAVRADGTRALGPMRWGLVPPWATDLAIGARMINARAETVAVKPAFRSALRHRRCLVAADGFYEWERIPRAGAPGAGVDRAGARRTGPRTGIDRGRAGQPWFIRRRDGAPLAFAGLWETWRPRRAPAGATPVRTAAVLTTSANAVMVSVHDRMPAMLERRDWAAWLDPSNDDVATLGALLVPANDALLERYPVTSRVNSVRNNGSALLEPAELASTPGSSPLAVPLRLL